jgi:hypothetical protein
MTASKQPLLLLASMIFGWLLASSTEKIFSFKGGTAYKNDNEQRPPTYSTFMV